MAGESTSLYGEMNATVTDTVGRFVANLERYIADGQKSDVLMDHQKNIFEDMRQFLSRGGRRGYIEAPTGTGKTVLFVSLAEALSYNDDTPPKILVVAPTIDLVHQTVGGTDRTKGFAGFAPDMSIATLYGQTPQYERKNRHQQVTVTTYSTMLQLAESVESHMTETGLKRSKPVNKLNDFDVIILDESHHALGNRRRSAIEGIEQTKLVIGFTATPDFDKDRRLGDVLPTEIHKLDLKESINMGMLSPVVPLSVTAPGTSTRHMKIGNSGEYDHSSLREMLYDKTRNAMIADLAITSIKAGNSPIIACIPGDEMIHPQLIASILHEREIVGDNGVLRPVTAASITSAMKTDQRQRIYAQFEAGDIDVLTYINILTEGWDSQRANTLINARPSRSPLAARQRIGRVLRSKTDNRPAFVIDILDTFSSDSAPPVSMADIFGQKSLVSGDPIGTVHENYIESSKDFLQTIIKDHGYVETVYDDYSRYAIEASMLKKVKNGLAPVEKNGVVRQYSTAERLWKKMGIDSLLLDELRSSNELDIHRAQQYAVPIDVYSETQVNKLLDELPDGAKRGSYTTIDGKRFMHIDDVVAILHAKYDKVKIDHKDVEDLIRATNDSPVLVRFTKHHYATTHRNVSLYTASTVVDVHLAQILVKILRDDE